MAIKIDEEISFEIICSLFFYSLNLVCFGKNYDLETIVILGQNYQFKSGEF